MNGGAIDELLSVTVECPLLEQHQVEVGCTLEDWVHPGLTGDDGESVTLTGNRQAWSSAERELMPH